MALSRGKGVSAAGLMQGIGGKGGVVYRTVSLEGRHQDGVIVLRGLGYR